MGKKTRRSRMKGQIFRPQNNYQKSQRRKRFWNTLFILMGLAGLAVFVAIFVVEGLATVERAKSSVSFWWYVVGAALAIPSLLSSIWNVFWFQSTFAFLKKRGGGGEGEQLATRGIGWKQSREGGKNLWPKRRLE